MQQNSRICFPSFHPPTTFLVPSFTVQMIFFIAPAGNKLKSEREKEQEAAAAAIAWRGESESETRCDIKKAFEFHQRNGSQWARRNPERRRRVREESFQGRRNRITSSSASILPIWPIWGPRRGAAGIRVMITDVEKTANSSSGRRRRGCQCQRHGRDKPLINKPNNEWTGATAACGGGEEGG